MKKNKIILSTVLAVVAIAAILFFVFNKIKSSSKDIGLKTLTGTLNYEKDFSLSKDVDIYVLLQDISKMDAPAEIVSMYTVPSEEDGYKKPLDFSLDYHESDILENHTYAVSAQVYFEEELIMTTTNAYLVITNNMPTKNLELMLEPVVAFQEGDLFFTENQESDINLAEREGEKDETKEEMLEENKEEELGNEEAKKDLSLIGKKFTLSSLNGEKITNVAGVYTLSFEEEILYAKLCNNMNGKYTLESNTLKAPALMSTLMYCMEPKGLMDAEDTFSAILSEGAEISFEANTLTLKGDKGTLVFSIQ